MNDHGMLSDKDRSELDSLVSQGYLKVNEKGRLCLYNYTDKCTWEKNWTYLTRMCRGLIVEKYTGLVVAKTFEKFFNLNEHPETLYASFPDLPYTITEKVDGSLAIIFNYENEWQIATRGSFYSEQAFKAQEIIKKYDLRFMPKNFTLLAEIIYLENKIVVNYGDTEKLVLLTAYDRETGEELSSKTCSNIASMSNMELVEYHNITILQAIEMQKTLPKDREGFVIRFDNGLRIKIKGEEYMRIHRLIMFMTPLTFWESMKNGIVDRTYLMQLPEEFKDEFTPIVITLEDQYSQVLYDLGEDCKLLPTREMIPEGKKQIGLFIQSKNNGLKHPHGIFPYLSHNKLEKYCMKQIRPTGNVYKEGKC